MKRPAVHPDACPGGSAIHPARGSAAALPRRGEDGETIVSLSPGVNQMRAIMKENICLMENIVEDKGKTLT